MRKASPWRVSLCLSLALLGLGVPAAAAQPGTWQSVVVWVRFPAGTDLVALTRGLDVWEVHRSEGFLVAAVDPGQLADLEARGFVVEVDEARSARLDRPLVLLGGQTSGIPSFPCYRTVEETYASMEGLVAAHPGLASWIDIGDSWEKLTAGGNPGYDLRVLVLTNSAHPGAKARLFLMAEIHAREYATAEIAARFAELLVAGFGTDPDITWLLNHNEVHILVMTNPDGRKIAEGGYYQRKNTNTTNGSGCAVPPTSSNHYGIDLNRNSSFYWGDASTYPCDATYQGPTAASEPETQTMQAYVASIFADQRGPGINDAAPLDATGAFFTLHSYSELVLWPWGFTSGGCPNESQFITFGRKLAYLNHYTPQQSSDLYPTTGSSDDWAYGELGVAAFTFEVGTDFFQSCSSFEAAVYPDNRDALLYALKAARRPYRTPAGPDSLSLSFTPAGVASGGTVTVHATANSTRYAGGEPTQPIAAARLTIDEPSWTGATTAAMTPDDGAFNETIEPMSGTLDATGLTVGHHLVLVESQDSGGDWGPPTAAFLCVAAGSHGVGIAPANSATTGDPGKTITYRLTVTNSGADNESFTVAVSGNAWSVTLPPSVGPVGPCDTVELLVGVQVPAGVDAGASDDAIITVSSPADPTATATATLTTTAAAGFTVTPVSGLATSEGGGSASFAVLMTAGPAAPVSVSLTSSDLTEGTVAPPSITFSPSDWTTPRTITVTGVDDFVADGPVPFAVITGPATGSDPRYTGLDPADVGVTNTDNDTAGIAVAPTTGLTTTEHGTSAIFTVRLTSQPVAPVSIAVASTDASEGVVSPLALTFTQATWSSPQTVTVTGQDDLLADGVIAYTAVTAPAVSSDGGYQGRNAADVALRNLDDESADLAMTGVDSPDPVPANTPLTTTFTVTNAGLLDATGVTFTQTVPAGATMLGSEASQGSCSGAGPVVCALGPLSLGAGATVTTRLQFALAGTVTSTATISAAQPDPATANNSVTLFTTVVAFAPVGLAVDHGTAGVGSANLNGVFEPGETVLIQPTWKNHSSTPGTVTSTASSFAGPLATSYLPWDRNAAYGTIGAGATATCSDCFAFQVGTPATRTLHWDASFQETLSTGTTRTWELHIGGSFLDAGTSSWAYGFIETLLHNGVTTGCDPANRLFCPAGTVSRDQMGVFIARALAGGDAKVPESGSVAGKGAYACVTGGSSLFGDVQPTDWFCRHVHALLAASITTGCDPAAGLYCPTASVARGPMAVFIARAVAGGEANVPAVYTDASTGRAYSCVASSPSTHFTDVTAADWYCKHVHYLWAKDMVGGCDPVAGLYCPVPDVTREQMAKFLVNGFGLKLY